MRDESIHTRGAFIECMEELPLGKEKVSLKERCPYRERFHSPSILFQVKGMVQEQKLEREVERASRMKEERGEMERELREKETELTSTARSLQAKEHHVRLAEEQVHIHFWQETFCFS